MIPTEPAIALAASPREWAPALQRHIADHGGARLRATVLHPDDALAENADVFVLDDTTSFLTGPLVAELHRRGRGVLGVFDPGDPTGKDQLRSCGVDDVIERYATPSELLTAIARIAPSQSARSDLGDARAAWEESTDLPSPPRPAPGAAVAAVVGASGGVGTTEVALALASSAPRGGRSVALVDAEGSHALACRLGLGLYPNVLAAADAVARGRTLDPCEWLQPVGDGPLRALVGGNGDVEELRGDDLRQLLGALAEHGPVVLDAGAGRTAATGAPDDVGGGLERHLLSPSRAAQGRSAVLGAHAVVLVADGTPVGLGHALAWLAAVHEDLEPTRLHVLINHSPEGQRARRHIEDELVRLTPLAGLWHVPTDPRVRRAAWDGTQVTRGPLPTVARQLAAAALGVPAAEQPARSGRRLRWRRRRDAEAASQP